jgi:hypothetical protein
MSDKNADNDENNENNNKDTSKNNWKTFGVSVLTSFCIVLIVGLLGANFVYYTRINLDLFFPSDVNQRPYTDEDKAGNKLPPLFSKSTNNEGVLSATQKGGKKMKGGSNSNSCGAPIDFTESNLFDNKYFSGMFEYGFPYSMESRERTFGSTIANWFPNKAKYSYSLLRRFVKGMFGFIGSTCSLVPESMKDIVPFVLGPIVFGIIILVASFWWIPTLVSVFWNENQNWGFFISILGLFFGWTWSVPVILTFFQVFGLIFSFVLLPVMLNSKKIMEIMGNKFNSYYLLLLFFIMTIVSAFTNLQTMIALPMVLIFLIGGLIPPSVNPLNKTE